MLSRDIPDEEKKFEMLANTYHTFDKPFVVNRIDKGVANEICKHALSDENSKQHFKDHEDCMHKMQLCSHMIKDNVDHPKL